MHTLFLEDLNVGVFTFFLGEINNVLFRCNADYRFLPSWSIEAQAVVAKSSQTHPLLKKIAQATRFDLTLKYHFDLSQLGKD